ncbi:lipopolysaccharide assembly protein LapA domain-containing protein [Salinarimonas soli]|uniref:DUF1049 domain-containing protein n=1 Tax=Salinarimonas soli TaxID=1638099 RepID=A0A5B2VG78_9HYPH|nr:lipopolysaccharide assembly protein LapA domain-containing protein [Salinarimonas soli]KAA2237905.1 DUF1049 domain-containing protein [Salinarimonas soli]
MKTFLKALLLVPLSLIVVLLAIANRGPVRLSLDPFSADAPMLSYELPLFLVLFGAVMLGVLIGGIASWLGQSGHRRAGRRYRREARTLRTEVQQTRSHPGGLPALTSSQPR